MTPFWLAFFQLGRSHINQHREERFTALEGAYYFLGHLVGIEGVGGYQQDHCLRLLNSLGDLG
jgi:hypothetical protein